MKSFVSFIFSVFFSINCLFAKPLPEDSTVIKGKLPNGLSYYIRSNAYPKDRASFYFIQKTGAALEEDNENGLAHFLEHMAFNGTEHFEGNSLMSTLETYGVKFGENLNAYTGFDETVYKISNAPTDQDGVLNTCLLILKDWSSGIVLDKGEIEKERGVIMEEWRVRQNATTRIWEQFFPTLTQGSIYAERNIIGDTVIIQNFKRKTLKNFHKKWYRPDLQGIVVVGDFDALKIEQEVKSLFGAIPTPSKEMDRVYASIPDNEAPLFVLATDPEQLSINYILVEKQKDSLAHLIGSNAYYKHQKTLEIYQQILKERFQRIVQQSHPPFVAASSKFENFIAKGSQSYTINAVLNPKEIKRGIVSVLEENYRLQHYGFYESELKRAQQNLIKSLDNAYKNRDLRTHDNWAKKMQSHFLNQSPILDIATHIDEGKAIVSSITLEDLNEVIPSLNGQNQVHILTAPETYRDSLPTKEELLTLLAEANASEMSNIEESDVPTELIPYSLGATATIIQKERNDSLGAAEWLLSNGARVVYKYSDLNKDKVKFRAFSDGGFSLVDLEDLPSADMANAAVAFGVSDYDPLTLEQILSGKDVNVTTMIGEISEEMKGSCSVADFEELLQLIYLRFEQPRFDTTQYQSIMDRVKMQLTFKKNSPEMAMMDSILQIMSNGNERTPLVNDAYVEKIELAKIEKIYRERFSDASDFTFIFVGNIKEEEAISLIEKYIGAIKSKGKSEEWVDHHFKIPPDTTVKRVSVKMKDPKAVVCMAFRKDISYSYPTKLYSDLLGQMLKMRYIKSIREEESGTYGVTLQMDVTQFPRNEMNCVIAFNCMPSRVDSLKSCVYKEIDDLLINGPREEEKEKVRKLFVKKRAEQKQNSFFWENALYQYYYNSVNIDSQESFYQPIKSLTCDDLQAAMRTLFSNADVVDLIFEPATND